MTQQVIYYNPQEDLDEEININFKKILFAIWSRKSLIALVFIAVLFYFILNTFIFTKKYTVDADLYINKASNSNLLEVNPYAIEEGGMASILAGNNSAINNELELMQSAIVIDSVIKENDIKVKKLFGFITTKKTGTYVTTEKFLKKGIKFENKKGTNVITIKYKNKDRELAYNVVNSIINNYIALHKDINNLKSKSDKQIIERGYQDAKNKLSSKIDTVQGLPSQAMAGAGNVAAMSAFSKTASNAMSTLRGQYAQGERSRLAVTEEAAKVAQLSSKLEWAKLVENMSDLSNVIILKAPRKLEAYEQTSPKLFTNILLGIVFGAIASLIVLIYKETTDEKLTYSMLGDEIIYNLEKEFSELQVDLLTNKDNKIAVVVFENFADELIRKLQSYRNIKLVKADISEEFLTNIQDSDCIMTIAKIGQTDSKFYKQIKSILDKKNKKIIKDILV